MGQKTVTRPSLECIRRISCTPIKVLQLHVHVYNVRCILSLYIHALEGDGLKEEDISAAEAKLG